VSIATTTHIALIGDEVEVEFMTRSFARAGVMHLTNCVLMNLRFFFGGGAEIEIIISHFCECQRASRESRDKPAHRRHFLRAAPIRNGDHALLAVVYSSASHAGGNRYFWSTDDFGPDRLFVVEEQP
jgi:hypothetical protein